jgi:hypothetical protein
MEWLDDQGPEVVPATALDRIMYLGSPANTPDGTPIPITQDGPQSYLAVQGAEAMEIPVHFHRVAQFQYFVQGTGTLGGAEVAVGVVHYADPLTPYGPMRAGAEGMSYATLRPRHDPGAAVMPDSSELLSALLGSSARPASERRNLTVGLQHEAKAGAPGQGGWDDLLADHDGLRIATTEVRPGDLAEPVVAEGGGAYVMVMDGAVEEGGRRHGPGATSWCDPGSTLSIASSTEGTRIALLQFPTSAIPESTGVA